MVGICTTHCSNLTAEIRILKRIKSRWQVWGTRKVQVMAYDRRGVGFTGISLYWTSFPICWCLVLTTISLLSCQWTRHIPRPRIVTELLRVPTEYTVHFGEPSRSLLAITNLQTWPLRSLINTTLSHFSTPKALWRLKCRMNQPRYMWFENQDLVTCMRQMYLFHSQTLVND
jgi:hypothetical protein